MRRQSLLLVILFAVAIALGLTWLALNRGSSYGGDDLVAEARLLPPFKRIVVAGSTTVILVQDTNGPAVVEAAPRAKGLIETRVRGDALEITAADRRRWWDVLFRSGWWGPSRITIHFADLEAIEVAGGVRITAKQVRVPALRIDGSGGTSLRIDDLRTTTLRVIGAGALKAELAGQVTNQTISISGAGDYQAAKLVSDNASVKVSGAGKVVVNATKTLQASISGAGVVEYLGDPEVKESVSGVGRVKRRESAESFGPHIVLAGPVLPRPARAYESASPPSGP